MVLRPIPCAARVRLTRRRFHLACVGSMAGLLAGCGGGDPAGQWPQVPTRRITRRHHAPEPGLRPLPARSLAGPSPYAMRVTSVEALADGGLGVAWAQADGADPAAPWRLRVLHLDGEGAGAGPEVLLPLSLPDPQAAARVLPDGGAVVAWREPAPAPGGEASSSPRFQLQVHRFDRAGQRIAHTPIPGTLVDGWDLDPPAIAAWVDGSFVVAWARVQQVPALPGTPAEMPTGLQAQVQALRFHANAEPDLPVASLGTSGHDRRFTLAAPDISGGFIIGQATGDAANPRQALVQSRLWHPIADAYLEALLPGSFLLSLGVCGWILFANRPAGASRQRFDWRGQAVGTPEDLPRLPAGAIALRAGDYLALFPSEDPRDHRAQRMNKSGEVIGAPFAWTDDPHALLPSGTLAVGRALQEGGEGWQLVLERFADRVTLGAE